MALHWKSNNFKNNDYNGFASDQLVARVYEFVHGPSRGKWYWSITADVKRHIPKGVEKPDWHGHAPSMRAAQASAEDVYLQFLEIYRNSQTAETG